MDFAIGLTIGFLAAISLRQMRQNSLRHHRTHVAYISGEVYTIVKEGDLWVVKDFP